MVEFTNNCCLCNVVATSPSALEKHIIGEHSQIFRERSIIALEAKKTFKESENKLEIEESDLTHGAGKVEDDQPEMLVTDIRMESQDSSDSPEVDFPEVASKSVDHIRRRLFSDSTVETELDLDSVRIRARYMKTSRNVVEVELLEPNNKNSSRTTEIDSRNNFTTRSKTRSQKSEFSLKNNPIVGNSKLTKNDSSRTVITRSMKRARKSEAELFLEKNSLNNSYNSKWTEIDTEILKYVLETPSNPTAGIRLEDAKVVFEKEAGRPLKKCSLGLDRTPHQRLADKVKMENLLFVNGQFSK
jgi:hypothetical protein